MAGKIIGIISLKGGVGKTTTVANLGSILAAEFKKKTLVVDANFSAPNLALHFGMVNPKFTIHDVLSNKVGIYEAIYKHEAGFHFIPAAYMYKKINLHALKHKIRHLRDYYDIIFLDSSPNLNEEMLAAMMASDELLVIASPDYPTLSTTLRAIRLAKQKGIPITGLILNRVRNKKFELSIKDIENAALVPVISVLPEDIKIPESVYYTTPVSLYKPSSSSAIEFRKLAANLIGEKYEVQGLWNRLKTIFNR